jgi:hypothetical protein
VTDTAPANALAEAECEALFEHVFQIAIAKQQELPEEERPTAADVEQAKANMHDELIKECVGADRVEFRYECAMAATDRAGLQGCMGAQ